MSTLTAGSSTSSSAALPSSGARRPGRRTAAIGNFRTSSRDTRRRPASGCPRRQNSTPGCGGNGSTTSRESRAACPVSQIATSSSSESTLSIRFGHARTEMRRWMPGFRTSSRAAARPIEISAGYVPVPIWTSPLSAPASRSSSRASAPSPARRGRPRSTNRRPAAVATAPVLPRSSRRRPHSSSSARRLRLRAGWVTPRRRAARARLPASTIATKYRRERGSREESLFMDAAADREGHHIDNENSWKNAACMIRF